MLLEPLREAAAGEEEVVVVAPMVGAWVDNTSIVVVDHKNDPI